MADTYLKHGVGATDLYFKVVKTSTNILCYYSLDGSYWLKIFDETIATHMGAITGIGLISMRSNTTAGEDAYGMCDWFRVTEP